MRTILRRPELGPEDSHYELTDDTIDYAPDGSATDWPTISPPAPSPFEPQPARVHEPESSNVFFPTRGTTSSSTPGVDFISLSRWVSGPSLSQDSVSCWC